MEEALCDTYDPWATDESWKMYSILTPEQGIDVNSKFVEFFNKKNRTHEIIVLINHSNASQETVFKSKRTIQLKNMRTSE